MRTNCTGLCWNICDRLGGGVWCLATSSASTPPDVTVQPLKGIALGVNHAVVDSLRQAATADLDGPAWDEAQVEVERGWLAPCEVEDLRLVHVAKRFPLLQGGKLRLIDAGGQNVDLKSAY